MEKSQIYLAKSSSSFLVGISNIWNPLTSSHSGPKTPKTLTKKNLYLKLHRSHSGDDNYFITTHFERADREDLSDHVFMDRYRKKYILYYKECLWTCRIKERKKWGGSSWQRGMKVRRSKIEYLRVREGLVEREKNNTTRRGSQCQWLQEHVGKALKN